jgi:hypothetical protein
MKKFYDVWASKDLSNRIAVERRKPKPDRIPADW